MKRKFTDKNLLNAWEMFFERPIGVAIEKFFKDDTVRGTIFTDGKIGSFTYPHDLRLLQNRTFLYHVIGNGDGVWKVPIGGMGALVSELTSLVKNQGGTIQTSVTVKTSTTEGENAEVEYRDEYNNAVKVEARFVLCGAAPKVLAGFLPSLEFKEHAEDEGSVFKMNMLLKTLPEFKASEYNVQETFSGTIHLDEGYEAMNTSYREAESGIMPENPPGEIYCHSMTDSSILSEELREKGYHTVTLFGLDMPYRLFKKDNTKSRGEAAERFLRTLNKYLKTPIEDCLARSKNGEPCIEAKSPVDIESELNMPSGNIFHKALAWPFAENEKEINQWGIETSMKNVLICGAGAKRGGGVSGIPGRNAAMKVLEILKLGAR